MTWIDDRGRLFGRWNIIDVFVVVAVALLLPVVYGAYWMFKPPIPKITTIAPTHVLLGTATRLTISGQYLRPFLTAKLIDVNARGTAAQGIGVLPLQFSIQGPERAFVDLPSLVPVGTYDIKLFDDANAVVTALAVLTIDAPVIVVDTTLHGRQIGTGWLGAELHGWPMSALLAYMRAPRMLAERLITFIVRQAVAVRMAAGDQDGDDDERAVIVSCDANGETLTAHVSAGFNENAFGVDQPVVRRTCCVQVPMIWLDESWGYRGKELRIGEKVDFHGQAGVMQGWVEADVCR